MKFRQCEIAYKCFLVSKKPILMLQSALEKSYLNDFAGKFSIFCTSKENFWCFRVKVHIRHCRAGYLVFTGCRGRAGYFNRCRAGYRIIQILAEQVRISGRSLWGGGGPGPKGLQVLGLWNLSGGWMGVGQKNLSCTGGGVRDLWDAPPPLVTWLKFKQIKVN